MTNSAVVEVTSMAVYRIRSKAVEAVRHSGALRIALPSPTERVARGLEWETSVYRVVVRVWNRYGNMYLDMDVAIESEVADTKGSTATGAPL